VDLSSNSPPLLITQNKCLSPYPRQTSFNLIRFNHNLLMRNIMNISKLKLCSQAQSFTHSILSKACIYQILECQSSWITDSDAFDLIFYNASLFFFPFLILENPHVIISVNSNVTFQGVCSNLPIFLFKPKIPKICSFFP